MHHARTSLIFFLFIVVPVFAFPFSDIWYSEFSARQHAFYLDEEVPVVGQLFLTYSDEGPRDGKAVLLIHGVPTSSWSYRILISILADSGYRVITPDKIEGLIILNTFAYEDGWDVPIFMDNPLVQFAMNKLGFRNRTIIRNTVCGMLVVTETLDNDISLSGCYEPLEKGADRAYLDFL